MRDWEKDMPTLKTRKWLVPIWVAARRELNLDPVVVGTADDGADREGDEISEQVELAVLAAAIVHFAEAVAQRVGGVGHGPSPP
jgi:hypothetical protein